MDDDKLAAPNRHKHFDDASGRLLYEWEQTLDEVNVFVPTDKALHATRDLNVLVTGNSIEITSTTTDDDGACERRADAAGRINTT